MNKGGPAVNHFWQQYRAAVLTQGVPQPKQHSFPRRRVVKGRPTVITEQHAWPTHALMVP
jgi:hypothetical protein